mgnify:CR=1 FL=1
MANYDLAVSWSGKDALADSSTAKVISGGDFHTEFTAVKAAVNTKADINGSASEAFSATTASAGTNTTQVATTAFVDASFAKKASPPLTGTPTAPTAATTTDTTQIATTAFVQANTPAASSSVLGLVKASLSGTTLTIATS